jgi:hypothetical protein
MVVLVSQQKSTLFKVPDVFVGSLNWQQKMEWAA